MEFKKNPKLDYRNRSALFFNIGLVLSLLIIISAFECKFAVRSPEVDLGEYILQDESLPIPITEHKPPSKPQLKEFRLIEIDDEKEIKIEEIPFSFDAGEVDKIEDVIGDFEEPDEMADEVLIFAETMPSYVGGLSEFYKFVSKNLTYPAQARRMGIEGKVFVHFIVDKDGSLTDIKVVKGIGAGCDAEVLRIINKSPKWNPGKQRGRPVRVQMMLPITFKLQ